MLSACAIETRLQGGSIHHRGGSSCEALFWKACWAQGRLPPPELVGMRAADPEATGTRGATPASDRKTAAHLVSVSIGQNLLAQALLLISLRPKALTVPHLLTAERAAAHNA